MYLLTRWRLVPSILGLGSMGNACCSKISSSSMGKWAIPVKKGKFCHSVTLISPSCLLTNCWQQLKWISEGIFSWKRITAISCRLYYSGLSLGKKKKIVMLPSHDQNLKIGSVGRDFFFFFFFLRTVRESSFPIFFFAQIYIWLFSLFNSYPTDL